MAGRPGDSSREPSVAPLLRMNVRHDPRRAMAREGDGDPTRETIARGSDIVDGAEWDLDTSRHASRG